METNQDAFFRELLGDFKIEAAEHQLSITDGLLKLEKSPPPDEYKKIVETTFREFHSLKGAARAVNQTDIERICQSVESVFQKLKNETIILSSPLLDLIYKCNDFLNTMVSEIDITNKSIKPGIYMPLLKSMDNLIMVPTPQPSENKTITFVQENNPEKEPAKIIPETEKQSPELPINERNTSKETVRIATRKLENLLLQAEEFIGVKATLGYHIKELQKTNHPDLLILQRDMSHFHHNLSRMVDDLLFDIKSTLLFPFTSLLEIVPKIIRDLGKEFDKKIELSVSGAETEIDRRILEAMKDPLIHLIRNCIDHGIETTEIRKSKNKPSTGKISIHISQEAGRTVEFTLRDDGAGINRKKLIENIIKNGLTTAESIDRMGDHELLSYIFRSGISTSQFITDLSGRGLGMAIVAEKVNGLGGSIVVDSIPDHGTKFTITLPLTLSTFRGVLVKSSEQQFIISTTAVERAIRISYNEIKFVESKPFFSRNGESIALVNLGDVLGVQNRKKNIIRLMQLSVLILSTAQNKIGFIVDEVQGEQEGIVKDFGPQLVHIKNMAGATVLGNGQVIPILNIPELMESALQTKSTIQEMNQEKEQTVESIQNILVAEDSITSRTLLRNILETAGFMVKTAVDGMEAFQFIQTDSFDLVVSDIEMPNMNGFELTSKIRNDARFTHIPVVLVTALSSDFDKQRGMDSGANAYIVKSNFEQSNLVETIKRLI